MGRQVATGLATSVQCRRKRERFVSSPTPCLAPPIHVYPMAIASADFNGDGVLDLMAANSGTEDVTVFLGNGVGTFVRTGKFAAGNVTPTSVTIGDFSVTEDNIEWTYNLTVPARETVRLRTTRSWRTPAMPRKSRPASW